jgi:hypothetical protein
MDLALPPNGVALLRQLRDPCSALPVSAGASRLPLRAIPPGTRSGKSSTILLWYGRTRGVPHVVGPLAIVHVRDSMFRDPSLRCGLGARTGRCPSAAVSWDRYADRAGSGPLLPPMVIRLHVCSLMSIAFTITVAQTYDPVLPKVCSMRPARAANLPDYLTLLRVMMNESPAP